MRPGRWPIAALPPPADAPPRARLRHLVGLAALAPSIRNSQPWRVTIAGDDVIEVRVDRSRGLAVADPEGRGAITSCGALVGALEVALRAAGSSCAIDRLPDPGAPALVARLRIAGPRTPDAEETWMFQALPKRRTQRGVMANQAVAPALVARLEALAAAHGARLRVVAAPAERRALAALIAEGDRLQRADPALREELAAAVIGDPEARAGEDLGAGMPAHRGELAAIRAGAPSRLRTFGVQAAAAGGLSEGTASGGAAAELSEGTVPNDLSHEAGPPAPEDPWIPDARRAPLELGALDLLGLGDDPEADDGAWIHRLRPAGSPGAAGALAPRPRRTALEVTIAGPVDAGERLAPAADAAAIDAGSPLLAVLVAADAGDGPLQWLRAGEALARVLLRARVDHLHASFFGQPIEVPALRAALRAALGLRGAPQLVLRLGHAGDAPATPRRALDDILTET